MNTRTGGVENGLASGACCPRPCPPRPAGCCAPAGAGACGAAACCAIIVAPASTEAAASSEIRILIRELLLGLPPRGGRTSYLRFTYVLLNPLRLFVTVKVPSGCTDTL